MKKFFKALAYVLLAIIVLAVFWVYSNLRDRNPGYKADQKILNTTPAPLKAGFAAFPITPEVPDRWVDKNKDAEYHPEDGDTFTDGNGNGVCGNSKGGHTGPPLRPNFKIIKFIFLTVKNSSWLKKRSITLLNGFYQVGFPLYV